MPPGSQVARFWTFFLRVKRIDTIALLFIFTFLLSGCYNSIGFKSDPGSVIESGMHRAHNRDNRNFKVCLRDGRKKKYCCISHVRDNVVFFNELKKDELGYYYYEPHGIRQEDIRNITYWNGETFGSIFGDIMVDVFIEAVNIAVDEAVYGDWGGGGGNSRSGSKSGGGSKGGSKSSVSGNSWSGKRPGRQ